MHIGPRVELCRWCFPRTSLPRQALPAAAASWAFLDVKCPCLGQAHNSQSAVPLIPEAEVPIVPQKCTAAQKQATSKLKSARIRCCQPQEALGPHSVLHTVCSAVAPYLLINEGTLVWYTGRGTTLLTPPPLPFHATSFAQRSPKYSIGVVPPTAVTYSELAGKLTPVTPLMQVAFWYPGLDPHEPDAVRTVWRCMAICFISSVTVPLASLARSCRPLWYSHAHGHVHSCAAQQHA